MSVMALAIGGCVVALGALILGRLAASPIERALAKASETKDASPVLEAINALKPEQRLGAYNRTIRRFWAAYERDLAMPLIRHLAMEFPDQLIAQYWLDRARSAEPELTDQYLGQDFLTRYFKPKLAAQCGGGG